MTVDLSPLEIPSGLNAYHERDGWGDLARRVTEVLLCDQQSAQWEVTIVGHNTDSRGYYDGSCTESPGAGWEPFGVTAKGDVLWRRRVL
mgnify:CR=1 FL=1